MTNAELADEIEYRLRNDSNIDQTITFAAHLWEQIIAALRQSYNDQVRLTDLESQNKTLRNAQKACATCDAPTMEKVAELEKDAERYRWLNKQHNFLAHIQHNNEQKTYRLRCGEPLDVWIDARVAEDAAINAIPGQEPHQKSDDSSSKS